MSVVDRFFRGRGFRGLLRSYFERADSADSEEANRAAYSFSSSVLGCSCCCCCTCGWSGGCIRIGGIHFDQQRGNSRGQPELFAAGSPPGTRPRCDTPIARENVDLSWRLSCRSTLALRRAARSGGVG